MHFTNCSKIPPGKRRRIYVVAKGTMRQVSTIEATDPTDHRGCRYISRFLSIYSDSIRFYVGRVTNSAVTRRFSTADGETVHSEQPITVLSAPWPYVLCCPTAISYSHQEMSWGRCAVFYHEYIYCNSSQSWEWALSVPGREQSRFRRPNNVQHFQ